MNNFQRIALAEKGLKLKDLCNVIDRTTPHVSNVLAGRFKSPGLRKKISVVLDKPESYLWPENYEP